MDASKTIVLVLATAVAAATAPAQTSKPTIRHHRIEEVVNPVSPAVTEAEAAIANKDYATAEQKLNQAIAKDPKDYQAWYDLGFVLNATGRKAAAIDAYRKSVAAKPDVFESNLNLGLLLASQGDSDAATFLRNATQLKPSAHPDEGLERAWLGLGHFFEKSRPQESEQAFAKAAELQPKDVEPHLSAGAVLESQRQFAAAEKEYRKAAELTPGSPEPWAALANLYSRQGRLPEAETVLHKYLAAAPGNATAHVQLGRVLAAEGKAEEATAEYAEALKLQPGDTEASREIATALVEAKKYPEAIARYQALVDRSPYDADLRLALGGALLRDHKFPEAQDQFVQAVKLKPDSGEAYGQLALAASENSNYPLVIQALDARAKLMPETPGTYFLRATAYDHLRAYKQAVENYHRFLQVAEGKFPEQEWQARHRLVAIDPKAKK